AGTTLTDAKAKKIKLGTTIGNIGFEGVTNDPIQDEKEGLGEAGEKTVLIIVKESEPETIFAWVLDWENLTATVGSPTEEQIPLDQQLFPAEDAGTLDFADVFALAKIR